VPIACKAWPRPGDPEFIEEIANSQASEQLWQPFDARGGKALAVGHFELRRPLFSQRPKVGGGKAEENNRQYDARNESRISPVAKP
jgi:hypothetical protein